MKIIHCADLHLDSKMESNLSKEKAVERREELLATFVKLVDYAVNHDVTAIIIAGDMFDTAQNTQKRIKNRVLDLIRYTPEIEFLYLRGNHDKVDFFDTLEDKPANLKLFQDSWTSYTYGNVVITGCELNRSNHNNIYSELVLAKEAVNIVVLHGQESKYDSKSDAELISLTSLQNRYIDYLALGHIHTYKHAKLDNRGSYCYSGCLEGRGFDECGEKGFVLIDIQGDKVNHSFYPIAKRTLHEIPVGLSGFISETELQTEIEESIAHLPQEDLVKIILEGDIDENTDIDVKYLMNKFDSRFYFLKIYDHTKLQILYENYINDISLKGEFLRLVKEQEIEEDIKREIMMLGLKVLAGREIDI